MEMWSGFFPNKPNLNPKPFLLRIYHGGHFIPDGKICEKYIGGEIWEGIGFDPDRFGCFDLVEELNKLGLDSWDRLSFQRKREVQQIDIKGDAEVMLMLKCLTTVKDQVCDVYVVGGKKGSLEQIVEEKSVGGGDTMGDEAVKHRVVEFKSVRKTNVEYVNKSKRNTNNFKGWQVKNSFYPKYCRKEC